MNFKMLACEECSCNIAMRDITIRMSGIDLQKKTVIADSIVVACMKSQYCIMYDRVRNDLFFSFILNRSWLE